jgi:hypothetical protein
LIKLPAEKCQFVKHFSLISVFLKTKFVEV